MNWDTLQQLSERLIDAYAAGVSVTVGSLALRAVESTMDRGQAAARWGANTTYRVSLTIALGKLTAGLPAVRSLVTWRAVSMRIVDLQVNRLAGTVTLHLEDAA